jgi:hypothetical protein
VRLFALLLTLLILGSGGYIAGSLPFRQDWVDIYQLTLTALGAVAALSTFFLGQTISRIDKLMDFPLDSLQQGALRRNLKKRRTRLVIKYWIGFISGILAIALGNALKLAKLSIIAGCGTAFMVVGLTCLFLLLIEFFALTRLYEQLKEGSEQQKKKQAFLSGSAA